MILLLLSCAAALADPGSVAALDPTAPPWGLISGASPGVALACALIYGAWQGGRITAQIVAAVEALLKAGIPVRVELAPADREIVTRAVEERGEPSGARRLRGLRDASVAPR